MNTLFAPFRELELATRPRLAPVAARAGIVFDAVRTPDSLELSFDLPGYAPSDVELSVDRNVLTLTADSSGNFAASFTMPARWADGSTIPTGKMIVLAATGDFAVQSAASFDFFATPPNPSINLSPTSGGAGTRVTAAGAGFPPNAPVAVYLATLDTAIGKGAVQQYVSGMADSSGRYSLSFTMPSTWPNGSNVIQNKIVVTVALPDFSVSASKKTGRQPTSSSWLA